MSTGTMKYNPGIWGDEEIIRAFVVRKVELDSILESLRSSGGSSNQHVLLVGLRGIGKTTLVRRVAAEVRRQASLSASWYPLAFGEEAYQVGTAGEFWLEAIFHLSELTQDDSWKRTYEELRGEKDDVRLRERALGQLMDFVDQQGKRILLIVENLGLLSEQLSGNADWELRHPLQNEARLMLLATAVSRFDAVTNVGKAWFDLFAIHELEPLGRDQCVELWRSVSGGELDAGRSRAVRILTGGNPRLLTILAEFAAKKSFRELMEQLVQLIDSHTEYFKNHLESLGVLERKVFVVVLESGALVKLRLDRGLINAAAAGHAKKALRTVTNSAGASALEPLIVGLRVFLGEKPRVAKEILKVGQDVADRIRKRQLHRLQKEPEAAEGPVAELPGKRPVRPQQLPG